MVSQESATTLQLFHNDPNGIIYGNILPKQSFAIFHTLCLRSWEEKVICWISYKGGGGGMLSCYYAIVYSDQGGLHCLHSMGLHPQLSTTDTVMKSWDKQLS